VTGASPLAGDVRQTGKNAALNGKMSPGPVPAKRVVPGQMRWKSCHPASLPLALRKRGRNRNSKRKRQGQTNEKRKQREGHRLQYVGAPVARRY
jgi:hypothetical protein